MLWQQQQPGSGRQQSTPATHCQGCTAKQQLGDTEECLPAAPGPTCFQERGDGQCRDAAALVGDQLSMSMLQLVTAMGCVMATWQEKCQQETSQRGEAGR